MFCNNCGNNLDDTATVCNRCGAPVSGQGFYGYGEEGVLSKKKYFKSRLVTDKAKSRMKTCRVIFGINTFLSVFAIIGFALVLFVFSSELVDFSDGLVTGMKELEAKAGVELYDDSFWESMDELEKTLEAQTGMSFSKFAETLPAKCIINIIALIAIFVVSLIAVKNINTGCAIAFTVLAVLFSGWLVIAGAAAVLVMTNLLNKEYKQYSQNIGVFSGLNGNEPDFS